MTVNTAVSRVKGSRKKITMGSEFSEVRPLEGISLLNTDTSDSTLSVKEFIEKQQEFLLVKRLEGLAERTLKDYCTHFQYLNRWILQEYCEGETMPAVTANRYVDKGLFMAYTGEMISQFKPATVNIRLRTLKCYLKWLYSEEIIKEDISAKLKLVKVPKDTIQPLTPQEVKKYSRR